MSEISPAMNEEQALAILMRWESGELCLYKIKREIISREITDDPEAVAAQFFDLITGKVYPNLIDPRTKQKFDYEDMIDRRDDNMLALANTIRRFT